MSLLNPRFNANDFKKLYDIKTDYPQDVKKEIKLYTIDEDSNKTMVIGSFSYRSGNASDVDFLEELHRDNKVQLIQLFKAGIRKVVSNLERDPTQYFMEVKLGLDHLFSDVVVGTCANNLFFIDSNFINIMHLYHQHGFISDEEYEFFESLRMHTALDQLAFEKTKQLIRKHSVLRWTSDEIRKGYKVLHDLNGPYNYTIEQAVQEMSNINVEGIFINDSNIYSDVSNFFALDYKTKYGKKVFMNIPLNDVDFREYRMENLKQSMYTLTYSKLEPNLFKAIKRMISYGISFKMIDLLTKSYNMVNTQYGRLYALNSQLKTVKKVIEIHGKKHLFKPTMYHQLDYIRYELYNLIHLELDLDPLIHDLGIIINENTMLSPEEVIDILDHHTHINSAYLNKVAKQLMQENGLYPLPQYLTPQHKPF